MRPAVAICAFLILAIPLLGTPLADGPPGRADIDILPDDGMHASVAPTAVLIARPSETDVDEEVVLDATDSQPGTGKKMWFRFKPGDGTPVTEWGTSPVLAHTYSKKGTFRAEVEVKNENEETNKATVEVTIGQEDDDLLFGLSAVTLLLIVAIAAIAIGLIALLIKRKRKRSVEPAYGYPASYHGSHVEEDTYEDDLPEDDYPDEEDLDEPVEAVDEVEPTEGKPVSAPKRVRQKTLMVNCPNCDNSMEIKYSAPPVFLTCDRCGMKGEIPPEMLD